jgi:RNA polymerase sigma-70 factor (ECF subfamily)
MPKPSGHNTAPANEKAVELAASAFRQHHRQIYRFLLRRTRNPEDAEDLTQEVFADAAAALEDFRPGTTPILALLYTIARRRFADAARRRGRSPLTKAPIPIDEVDREQLTLEDEHEVALAIRDAVDRLPEELRDVVTMKLVFGLSFAEISERAGASEVACRKRFQRGLGILRQALADERISS